MPIHQPKQLDNSRDYGTPDTLRSLVPLSMFYVEFFDSYGRRKRELVIERKTPQEVSYLTLEGGVKALKQLNPALHKMVAGVRQETTPPPPATEEVAELTLGAQG